MSVCKAQACVGCRQRGRISLTSKKISGNFFLIPRVPFRFLSSEPTSFSDAAITNS